MAIFNEILVGRFNKSLQRHFGIKGHAPVRQLGGEVMPVIQLSKFVESLYLESWNFFSVQRTQSPIATQFSQLQIRNPPNSNIVAIILRAWMTSTIADGAVPSLICMGPKLTDFSTIEGPQLLRFDARGPGGLGSSLIGSSTVGASSTFVAQRLFLSKPANGFSDFLRPEDTLPLLPGDAFMMQGSNGGSVDASGIWWMERYLEESERI